jgi:hypothetical protein
VDVRIALLKGWIFARKLKRRTLSMNNLFKLDTREKEIERKLVKMVKSLGGRCPKWVSPGSAGVPDRIILLPKGRIIFVELKRPVGGEVSALQHKWREWLTLLGFTVWHVFDEADLVEARMMLDEILERRSEYI